MRIFSVAFFGHRYVQHAIQAERLWEGLIRKWMV